MSYRSMKLELQGFASELNAIQCGMRLNRSYQHLLDANPWSFLKGESLIVTVAPHTTGTVTVTQGSATVSGAGTLWTAAMAGRFFRTQDSFTFYKVSSVDAALQTLTLESTYALATAALQPYTLFQYQYAKPADCKDILGIRYDSNLGERTKAWIDTLEPDRNSTGQPQYWINFNDTTLELWPVPDAIYKLRVWYNKLVPDMSAESDVCVLPERVVVAHAVLASYRQLASRPEGAAYLQLVKPARDEFTEAWTYALEQDMRRASLPTQVLEAGIDFPLSNEYVMKHDVFDPRRP